MSVTEQTATRCFGHSKARELSAAEIEQVAGGPTYTNVSMVEWIDEDGDGMPDGMDFAHTDYDHWNP